MDINNKKILSMLVAISVLTANSGNMVYALEEIKTEDTSVEQEVTKEVKEETKEDVTEESESKIIASGDFSYHLVWSIDDKGTMTVEGNGKLMMIPSDDESLNYDVRKIVFGKGVEYLDDDMFEYYPLLEAIEVSPENPFYASADGVFFNKDMTELVIYPSGKKAIEYIVPDSVVKINYRSCYGAHFSSVVIPDSVKVIEENAFYHSDTLVTVFIGKNVETIGDSAFGYCDNISDVYYSGNEEQWDSVEYIGDRAFYECISLTSVKLPKNLIRIQDQTFDNCANLENVEIPEGVQEIGSSAFVSCISLENVILPDSIAKIESTAFSGFRLLQSIELPEGIKEISENTFDGCSSLKWAKIPSNVETIGRYAFYCDSLTDVYYTGTQEQWSAIKIDVPGAILANIHFNATNIQGTDGTVGGNADIVYGDLDGNMKADLTDLSILSLYLLGDTALDESILKGADVNADGSVDLADLAHFKQYISKDDVILGVQ